jgi:hypothetical protein
MKRKDFLLSSGAVAGSILLNPFKGFSKGTAADPYPLSVVKDFVSAGHNNLSKVKEMLAEHPHLLYARYDLGNGDFEEAIEGAGHVGNREIAEFLINAGARPNVFVLTMLGETAIVNSILDKYPALLNAKGAHGFTLLHHATRGGEPARELLEILKSKGLIEMKIPLT